MSHRWLRYAWVCSSSALLAVAGCGSDGGGNMVTDDAGNTVTIDGGSTTTPDSSTTVVVGETLTAIAKGQMIAANSEREICEIYELPNTADVKVHGVRLTIDDGFSHHAIVQLANSGIWANQPHGTQFVAGGCSAPGDDGSPILIGTQVPVLEYQFPADVYFPMKTKQKLLLNYHYVNTGSTPKFTNVKVEIFHSDPAPRTQKAAALFYNWTGFTGIPAGQSSTQSTTCAAFSKNINVVTLNGHQHHFGTQFEAFRVNGATETKIYNNTDWDNPNYQVYNPILQIMQGERIKFTCTWQNTNAAGTQPIDFGTSKDDEMCILGGFIYPVTTDLIVDCGDTAD